MRRILFIIAALLAPLFVPLAAHAQTNGTVVSACGTAPWTYNAGRPYPVTVDTNGRLCDNAGGVTQGSTTSGQTGVLAQGAVTTGAPTYVTAQTSPLSLATNGALRVSVYGSDTTQVSATALSSDAVNPASQGLYTLSATYGFDGSNFARMRGNTTGFGIINGGLPTTHWNYAAATSGLANTTTAVTAKAAAGASVRNCVENVQLAHSTLGGVTEFVIRDGAAGTVIWRTILQTTASEGATYNLSPAICGTANTLMEFAEISAVTGAIYFSAQGYVSP